MLNQVILHGRLGRDPELRHTQSGAAVASVAIAVDRNGKDAGVDWIDLVAWEKTAELLEKYFRKGDEILVSGRLQARTYQDKDGNKRKAVEVVVNNIDFCGKKADREANRETPKAASGGFTMIPDGIQEELPFV